MTLLLLRSYIGSAGIGRYGFALYMQARGAAMRGQLVRGAVAAFPVTQEAGATPSGSPSAGGGVQVRLTGSQPACVSRLFKQAQVQGPRAPQACGAGLHWAGCVLAG